MNNNDIIFSEDITEMFAKNIIKHEGLTKVLKYIGINKRKLIRIKDLQDQVYINRKVLIRTPQGKRYEDQYTKIDRKSAERFVEILFYMSLIRIDETMLPNKLLSITERGNQVLKVVDYIKGFR